MNAPTAPNFPGMSRPGTDFNAVRDGRRAVPFYLPIDLSTARSIAAGTHLVVPLAGNSFYSDPLIDAAGVPIGGIAKVHFQDANLNPAGTPFTVAPQFIAKVPFTQLLIENPAQPGKFANFIYGVDIDFTPGINAQVSISGTVNTAEQGSGFGVSYKSNATLGANTPGTIVAPGSNVNGIRVWSGGFMSRTGGVAFAAILAKTSAPATVIDGDVIVGPSAWNGLDTGCAAVVNQPILVPAGMGLYFISTAAQVAAFSHLNYTIL